MNSPLSVMSLKEALKDWTDVDVAEYHLALCLGLMSPEIDFAGRAKHVFWSANPIGEMLYRILDELTQQGILEKWDEEYQFRWNKDFKGSWE